MINPISKQKLVTTINRKNWFADYDPLKIKNVNGINQQQVKTHNIKSNQPYWEWMGTKKKESSTSCKSYKFQYIKIDIKIIIFLVSLHYRSLLGACVKCCLKTCHQLP